MLLHALLLGLIQGITESLPVSSSGHLILVPQIFGFADQGLAVDATLHLATALAIFVYFRKEWWEIVKTWRGKNSMLRKIVVASIPAALMGLILGGLVETFLRSPWVVVTMLLVVAGVMWWVERGYIEVRRVSKKMNVELAKDVETKNFASLPNVDWLQAIVIGLAQTIALIPGTSRLGITITAGMWQHLPREQAARFSFLLGAPIALGAGLVKSRALVGEVEWQFVTLAGIVAFVTALVAIHWLLKFLNRGTLKPFIWYRFALAVIVVVLLLT